jgi:hypothetical protein
MTPRLYKLRLIKAFCLIGQHKPLPSGPDLCMIEDVITHVCFSRRLSLDREK